MRLYVVIMENEMTLCKTCGKLDQPHDPCDCPDIRIGSVVFHRDSSRPEGVTQLFRGPGTVTAIFNEFDVDFATVFWQSSCVTFDHRLSSLLTLAEMGDPNG